MTIEYHEILAGPDKLPGIELPPATDMLGALGAFAVARWERRVRVGVLEPGEHDLTPSRLDEVTFAVTVRDNDMARFRSVPSYQSYLAFRSPPVLRDAPVKVPGVAAYDLPEMQVAAPLHYSAHGEWRLYGVVMHRESFDRLFGSLGMGGTHVTY